MDHDGSGRITFDEFNKWWKTNSRWESLALSEERQQKVAQVAEFFKYYDADRSGALDTTEFPKLHAQLVATGYQLQDCATVTAEIDKSGDGHINFNEFLNWMLSMGAI